MSFLIVPNEAFGDTAKIWVGAIDENFDPAVTVLEYGSNQIALNANWSNYPTVGQTRIRYQRVPLSNLQPRTRYDLVLRVGGVARADGVVTTIPYRLPAVGEPPFIVFLGSCFYAREDPNGYVGKTYNDLPSQAKPDIKFLCGDQVYLDNPPEHFINPFRSHEWLQARSLQTYIDNWTQFTEVGGGFNRLLKHNANFFTSDDHEFWNNAPDIGLNVPLWTASESSRDKWMKLGRDLYEVFQTTPGFPFSFVVEPLSFCVAETRFNRGKGGSSLMAPEAFERIGEWARTLNGPGVLVLGQPFFANVGGRFGQAKDRGLPDYTQQYEQLKQYLRSSSHSIVILTGDVHYGRLSHAPLRPEFGTRLLEVISSPLKLVPHGGGDYEPPPQVFGQVTGEEQFSLKRGHFLTLEFTAPSAQRARMRVRFWPIQEGLPPQSQIVGKEDYIELI